jgi:nucleotide-binding universal stress UspA family protein
MATHGDSGLRRWALGSVTDKIVQAAEEPLLIVRSAASHGPPRLRRIMVVLDESDLTCQALLLAVELAEGAQAEMILFQAIAPTVEAYPYPPLPSVIQTLLHDQTRHELTLDGGFCRSPMRIKLILDYLLTQVIAGRYWAPSCACSSAPSAG